MFTDNWAEIHGDEDLKDDVVQLAYAKAENPAKSELKTWTARLTEAFLCFQQTRERIFTNHDTINFGDLNSFCSSLCAMAQDNL
jgi:hypothetical protein